DGAGVGEVRSRGVFGDRAVGVGAGHGDGRRVVGAGDGDRDQLVDGAAGVAVADGDGELLLHGLAGRQVLRGGVGNLVGPADRAGLGGGVLAHRAHGQGAAQRVAESRADAGGVRVGQIDVVEGDGAGVGEVRSRGVFGDRAVGVGAGHGYGRRVVGAGDVDRDQLADGAAGVAVADGDGELLLHGLAGRQVLRGGVGNLVGPADRAGLGGGVLAHRAHGQGAAQRVAESRADAGGVRVGQIDVVEGDGAGVGEVRSRGVFGDR